MKKIGYHKYLSGDERLTYKTVPKDIDGWVEAKDFLPADYDLVYLRIKNRKIRIGWINGLKWDGAHVNPKDHILAWKKKGV